MTTEMVICRLCKRPLPTTDFYEYGNGKRRTECKKCHNAPSRRSKTIRSQYNKHYRQNNRDRLAKKDNARYLKVKGTTAYKQIARKAHLKKYGLSPEQYSKLLEAQNGVCAICQRPPATGEKLAVDHHHATGKIRGLLHRTCNNAIGLLKDKAEWCLRAVDYLKRETQ
jgi:hypothetical protein